MKIALASDHAGFQLKEKIKAHLLSAGHEISDRGCFDESSTDYPDFGVLAARDVSDGKADRAILVCGSGIGMSIVANKIKGVRAALCTSVVMAEMSRMHNDANVLCLGARYIDPPLALQMIHIWLKTPFEGGRHQRRVDKINLLDRC
jgi:ribose 5-phosphate isomerase B